MLPYTQPNHLVVFFHCKVQKEIHQHLRYAFSSRALEVVLSPVFDRVANTFVDSFVQRAEQVYGVR